MSETTEYAPEHSTAYRVGFVLLGTAAGAFLALLSEFWLFPALSAFALTAHCRQVFGLPATSVLAYGLLVGIPLSGALVIAFGMGWRGIKILASGQIPPPGEKVFRKTPIRRGRRAQWMGLLHLLACTPLLALAIWGIPQAAGLSAMLQRQAPDSLAPAVNCDQPRRALQVQDED